MNICYFQNGAEQALEYTHQWFLVRRIRIWILKISSFRPLPVGAKLHIGQYRLACVPSILIGGNRVTGPISMRATQGIRSKTDSDLCICGVLGVWQHFSAKYIQNWYDPHFRWDPAQYGNRTYMMVHRSVLWLPDIDAVEK